MGSKLQRQMQHIHFLEKKIKRFEKKGKSTTRMEKELAYSTGQTERPVFKTGRDADARLKKRYNF